jgi:hypothetical protein
MGLQNCPSKLFELESQFRLNYGKEFRFIPLKRLCFFEQIRFAKVAGSEFFASELQSVKINNWDMIQTWSGSRSGLAGSLDPLIL